MLKESIFFLLSFLSQDEKALRTEYYMECYDPLVSHFFVLSPDSAILFREHSEGWKGRIKNNGKWKHESNIITFNLKDSSYRTYEIHKVESLYYLIPVGDKSDSEVIVKEIYDFIIKDELIKDIRSKGFSSNDSNKIEVLNKRIEYLSVKKFICGKGILVEVPGEFVDKDFEKYKISLNKNKQRSR